MTKQELINIFIEPENRNDVVKTIVSCYTSKECLELANLFDDNDILDCCGECYLDDDMDDWYANVESFPVYFVSTGEVYSSGMDKEQLGDHIEYKYKNIFNPYTVEIL